MIHDLVYTPYNLGKPNPPIYDRNHAKAPTKQKRLVKFTKNQRSQICHASILRIGILQLVHYRIFHASHVEQFPLPTVFYFSLQSSNLLPAILNFPLFLSPGFSIKSQFPFTPLNFNGLLLFIALFIITVKPCFVLVVFRFLPKFRSFQYPPPHNSPSFSDSASAL